MLSLYMEKELLEMIKKYRELTTKALEKAKKAEKAEGMENWAEEVIEMAESYLNDSFYFEKKNDLLRTLAALSYAHGWLDAGARIGLFRVNDSRLFTVDDL